MSDIRRVESDTKRAEEVMRALADTAGMGTPQRAAFWLEKLAADRHKGRHDTWTAARDRAAEDIGLERSLAKRIWQRWQTMNDVSGTPLLTLMLAYEAMCEEIEASADAMRAERVKLKARNDEADQSALPVVAGAESTAR